MAKKDEKDELRQKQVCRSFVRERGGRQFMSTVLSQQLEGPKERYVVRLTVYIPL